MDPITAQSNVISAPPAPTPSRSFRLIFLLLLLVVLASASFASYILITGNKPGIAPVPVTTQADNPFAEDSQTNPFIETSVASEETSNPFDIADSANPFDQFATDESTSNTNSYENPF